MGSRGAGGLRVLERLPPAAAPGVARGGGGGGGGRGNAWPWRRALQAAIDSLPPDRRVEFNRRLAVIDSSYPHPRAPRSGFCQPHRLPPSNVGIDHVRHQLRLRRGGGVTGWTMRPRLNVTLELVKARLHGRAIAKIWSGKSAGESWERGSEGEEVSFAGMLVAGC